MAKLILPAADLKAMIRERRLRGGDRYDEVWEGVYMMSPLADNEHQDVGFCLTVAIKNGIDDASIRLFHGSNVSNNPENWRENYRCPDVAVFLPGNPAEDRGSHWLGGPDFAVEVLSRGDRSRKKFEFYREVGVRELLLVGRKPWKLELHRCDGRAWTLVGISDLEHPEMLPSGVLGLSFRLVAGDRQPGVEITRATGDGRWVA